MQRRRLMHMTETLLGQRIAAAVYLSLYVFLCLLLLLQLAVVFVFVVKYL